MLDPAPYQDRQTSPRILVAGRIFCDLVFTGLDLPPAPGRERYARNLTITAGGGCFITSAYLNMLGSAVMPVASLGSDLFSRAIEEDMARLSLNDLAIERLNRDMSQVTIAMQLEGDRAFITHMNRAQRCEHLDLVFDSISASHLHIADLSSLRAMPELIPLARATRMSISLDCAWDEEAMDDPEVHSLIEQVDIFFPNAEELCRLNHLNCAPNHLNSAIDAWRHRISHLVIKHGAEGATSIRNENQVFLSGDAVTPVDATGAGDAFVAGYLHAWLHTGDQCDALALGSACGRAAVRMPGGASALPDREEVLTSAAQLRRRSPSSYPLFPSANHCDSAIPEALPVAKQAEKR